VKHLLVDNWNLLLVRGILAVLFGIATLLMPGITLIVLVVMFGAYALVEGILTSIMAIKERNEQSNWWLWLIFGLVSVGAGVTTFLWPGITAVSLFYVIVAWAITSGLLQIALAVELRKVIKDEWLLVLEGILTVGFGILLIAQPVAGALTVLWLIGVYAIANGVTLLVLALRLRNLAEKITRPFKRSPAHTA
jgi:uncharacterized membrane protein HdeD (DUF308 family)